MHGYAAECVLAAVEYDYGDAADGKPGGDGAVDASVFADVGEQLYGDGVGGGGGGAVCGLLDYGYVGNGGGGVDGVAVPVEAGIRD